MSRRRRGLPAPDGHDVDVRGPARPARPLADDRGAVTAELAVGLVAVAVVLLAVLATGTATLARIACVDAARTGARVAALGQDDGDVVAAARHVLGGRSAEVAVSRDSGWVTVTVSAPFGGWEAGGVLQAHASATAWAEP